MLLAVDSSTQWVGLALFDGAQVLGETIWRTHTHHTVELAPAISDLIARCGIHPSDLQVLAVARGPGSFTSLRIGMAVVKGMALALKLPVVGVPSLDILAAAQPPSELPLAALLQAGRGRFALNWYQYQPSGWETETESQVVTLEGLIEKLDKPALVAGELSTEDRQAIKRHARQVRLVSPVQSMRRPSWLADLAWKRWRAGKTSEVISLAPIYLHVAGAIPE